jgi:hypothetical protein
MPAFDATFYNQMTTMRINCPTVGMGAGPLPGMLPRSLDPIYSQQRYFDQQSRICNHQPFNPFVENFLKIQKMELSYQPPSWRENLFKDTIKPMNRW